MKGILADLERILGAVDETGTARLIEEIANARRVFMYGLGRSGLVARMFGMRLVHLGRAATIVGEDTTPAIRAGDLLFQCSRTGQSPILGHAVNLAHAEGALVAAVVGDDESPLAAEADLVVKLPLEAVGSGVSQPMGSLFEQALHLYLDEVVLRLMKRLERTAEDMERVHSNLP